MCDHHHHHNHDHEHKHEHESENEHHCHGHSHGSGSIKFFFTYASSGWKISEGRMLILYSGILGLSSLSEVVYGIYTGDTHVATEGFHTLFHALCIWAAMIALAYTINHPAPDSKCSFGYSRAQIIAAFGNSIFAFFIGFFALFEAIHEIITEEISDSNPELLPMLLAKISLHSIFFLKMRKYLFESDKINNDNLGVVSIHCLGLLMTDLIRGLCLYFEFECMAYPLYFTESALNIIWVVALLLLVRPYIQRNGRILLLCSPSGKHKDILVKKIREISLIEGVVGVKEEKMWMIDNQEIVGSLKIEVHGEGKHVVSKANEILKGTLSFVVVEIENSDHIES